MDDLINEFIAETREMLAALGGELIAWEAAPDDRAKLDAIFRFVHTVKGNCGFFDLPRIGALSHAAEDALATVRSGRRSADAALVSAVLAVVDRLGELVEALDGGAVDTPGDDSALIAALEPSATRQAASAEAAAAPAASSRAPARSVRLPLDLLDRMMSGVSDLVLARNDLARRLREAGGDAELAAAFERVSSTIADLRDTVTRTRMQRLETLFAPLPRMVRDLSAETGKPVALVVEGGDVEIDREMIEMIRDPLTHLVRNAIDHGIEPADERQRRGKPREGRIEIAARQAGNQILIDVRDDGRGIDAAAVAAKAVAAGLLTSDAAAILDEAGKRALVFEPGLSTAREVTGLSGRGVGMDVVRSNIERIGGLVDIDSAVGEGTRLTLRVPLTLTIIPALTVEAGGGAYALPRASIEEIVRVRGNGVRVETLGGGRVATVRGTRMPLLSLAGLLGVEGKLPLLDQSLLVLSPGGHFYALAVDAVRDHEELVVKPAAVPVMATGLYAGTTIADDGRPVLLLDPAGLAATAGLALQRRREPAPAADAPAADAEADALLFRSLCGARRLVPLAAILRIEEVPAGAAGHGAGGLCVAVGGSLLPLAGCEAAPERPFRLLRLSDGSAEIAYAFDEVLDTVATPPEALPVADAGEVRAVALLDGEPVELLDLFSLFSKGATIAEVPEAARPVCALPGGDAYLDSILRPLVESAGYRVVAAGSPEAAAATIVIVPAEGECPAPAAGGRVLRIRSSAEPRDPADDSIHRYDRAALLSALAGEQNSGRRRHG